MLNTAGGVVHDQAEADADMSVLQRVAIAVGKSNVVVITVCYVHAYTATWSCTLYMH